MATVTGRTQGKRTTIKTAIETGHLDLSTFAGTITLVISFIIVAIVAAFANVPENLLLLGVSLGLGAGAIGVFVSEFENFLSRIRCICL